MQSQFLNMNLERKGISTFPHPKYFTYFMNDHTIFSSLITRTKHILITGKMSTNTQAKFRDVSQFPSTLYHLNWRPTYCCNGTGPPQRTGKTLCTSISSGHAEHSKLSATPGRAALETSTLTVMCNLGGPPVSAPERVGGSAPSTNVASTLTSSSSPSSAEGNTPRRRAHCSPGRSSTAKGAGGGGARGGVELSRKEISERTERRRRSMKADRRMSEM